MYIADVLQEHPWSSVSEDDLFSLEAQSMASVHSADRSADNIVQRRSRVSSQENGRFLSNLSLSQVSATIVCQFILQCILPRPCVMYCTEANIGWTNYCTLRLINVLCHCVVLM